MTNGSSMYIERHDSHRYRPRLYTARRRGPHQLIHKEIPLYRIHIRRMNLSVLVSNVEALNIFDKTSEPTTKV